MKWQSNNIVCTETMCVFYESMRDGRRGSSMAKDIQFQYIDSFVFKFEFNFTWRFSFFFSWFQWRVQGFLLFLLALDLSPSHLCIGSIHFLKFEHEHDTWWVNCLFASSPFLWISFLCSKSICIHLLWWCCCCCCCLHFGSMPPWRINNENPSCNWIHAHIFIGLRWHSFHSHTDNLFKSKLHSSLDARGE